MSITYEACKHIVRTATLPTSAYPFQLTYLASFTSLTNPGLALFLLPPPALESLRIPSGYPLADKTLKAMASGLLVPRLKKLERRYMVREGGTGDEYVGEEEYDSW
ncbi:hypothetical protein Hypma_005462 [Hypsizygus marmoreus]|uniref:Uncharacterized protein n=1 Tax=Hypsizygus marmoreus TaxID=39966 RepID=A0A369J104_HYPMA|nr:hypothetical protein Hypma_005462 [Hypsizygus marmoreus]